MYHLYIIHSPTLDRYYIGSCADIGERLRRHNTKHKGFTGHANDWKPVHREDFPDKLQAQARERHIKSWKSRKLIEKLLKGG